MGDFEPKAMATKGTYTYDYPRPALTADCVVFGRDGSEELSVLLIERGADPFKGCWAFPGGFLEMDETTEACAARELQEETGLIVPAGSGQLIELGCYSTVDRDPRGRVITIAYSAVIDKTEVKGADDAREARWFPLSAIPPLAFDHAQILKDALNMSGLLSSNPLSRYCIPMEMIDLTTGVSLETAASAKENEKKAWSGHLGTHFDVMDKAFPLEYMERGAVAFDVSGVGTEREIDVEDIDMEQVPTGGFVAFHTGFIERVGYGAPEYFQDHPQLSYRLIEALLAKQVAIIAVDFAGIRRGREHTPADQRCADSDAFVVENICNLASLLDGHSSVRFVAGTYPVNFTGLTGLPCRVVARRSFT